MAPSPSGASSPPAPSPSSEGDALSPQPVGALTQRLHMLGVHSHHERRREWEAQAEQQDALEERKRDDSDTEYPRKPHQAQQEGMATLVKIPPRTIGSSLVAVVCLLALVSFYIVYLQQFIAELNHWSDTACDMNPHVPPAPTPSPLPHYPDTNDTDPAGGFALSSTGSAVAPTHFRTQMGKT